MIDELLGQVSGGNDLSFQQMSTVIDAIMRGQVSEERIGLLLTALSAKGECVDEVAGAASAMRAHMTPIRTQGHAKLVDTCGTGGAQTGIFNVSTAAALVTAATGLPVAKHGNRKVTSKSGSADVLTELGVNVEAPIETVERCLEEVGICFCFAQQLHPAMKHVAAVRRKLGVPTIFNMLGPLCNPAGAQFQLLGVGSPPLRKLLAGALTKLDTQRAAVVHGTDGLCEVTNSAETSVTLVTGDQQQDLSWTPADFAVEPAERQPLLAEDPTASAAIIREVFRGAAGPRRDIVVMNAAAAIWVAQHAPSLSEAAELAAAAIDDGKAQSVLNKLAEVSHS